MANEEPKHWEQKARDAASRVEEDLRRVVTYINDEVVPDIRRNGSQALRAAAGELQKLAQYMDDRRAASARSESEKDKPESEKGKPRP